MIRCVLRPSGELLRHQIFVTLPGRSCIVTSEQTQQDAAMMYSGHTTSQSTTESQNSTRAAAKEIYKQLPGGRPCPTGTPSIAVQCHGVVPLMHILSPSNISQASLTVDHDV